MKFVILICTVGLLSGIVAWDVVSVHYPQILRPWNPIWASGQWDTVNIYAVIRS